VKKLRNELRREFRGWRYFEERKTVFEVVVFIFEAVGVTASGLGVKFFEAKCFERENEHWDLHVWSRLIQWWNV